MDTRAQHLAPRPRLVPVLAALIALAALAGACRGSGVGFPRWLTPRGGGPFRLHLGGTRINIPGLRDADREHIAQLRVPPGFRVSVFARDLHNPRMMAVGPDGTLYVTRLNQGDVLLLTDRDRDGRADGPPRVVARELPQVNGVALAGDRVYLATPTRVLVAARSPDGALAPPRVLLDGLPEAGRHPNRTVALGPDGWLYVSVGSSCNVCVERDAQYAAVLRVRPDGTGRELFARGLRNTIGFDWHPVTGQLWGMDHGSDERGDDTPPEELNAITAGGDYGWPYCYGAQRLDARAVEQLRPPARPDCARTRPAAAMYTAHSAPMAMVFYRGAQFPREYRGDAFVAMHGSWNRRAASGYEVVRARFGRDGQPVGFEPFLSGFLVEEGSAQFGRPVGLAVAPDGALLVSDDSNGVIYRVAFTGA